MGGPGSTRWGGYTRRMRVEDALALDAGSLALDGAAAVGASEDVRWTNAYGREVAAIGWRRAGEQVELRYTVTQPGRPPRDLRVLARLERMPKPIGGFVWTWRCPRDLGGCPCGRRVLRLYLPPGHLFFGCRSCHRLAYLSSLRRDEWLRRALARFGMPQEVLEWESWGGLATDWSSSARGSTTWRCA